MAMTAATSLTEGDPTVRPAFLDPGLQQQFDRDGFVVVPFIDADRRRQLQDLFTTLDSGVTSGFYVSVTNREKGHRVAVHEGLDRICGSLPARYLLDYRLMLGTFAVKLPGPDSALGVHQDLSFVDEARFASVNCWFPVSEVKVEDGPLMVMKGSHRLFPALRGAFQPLFHSAGLRDVIVDRYLTALDIKPGDAALFSSRLVHYSPPNMGDRPRVAVSLTMIPLEAAPRFLHTHADGATEMFEVRTDFFYRADHGSRPADGTSLGRVVQEHPAITAADIERFYLQNPELR